MLTSRHGREGCLHLNLACLFVQLVVSISSYQPREDADLDIIVDHLWGACYHRLLVLEVPFDESIVERLVDHALYGAAPRGA